MGNHKTACGIKKNIGQSKKGFSPYQNTRDNFEQIMSPLQATIATLLICFDNNDELPPELTKGNT